MDYVAGQLCTPVGSAYYEQRKKQQTYDTRKELQMLVGVRASKPYPSMVSVAKEMVETPNTDFTLVYLTSCKKTDNFKDSCC